ncbi:MAG: PAS domain S-box protein, partial [Chloroflexi bacterium]|nr:PAS domain S-box protein [Chloroflexota bacterium]
IPKAMCYPGKVTVRIRLREKTFESPGLVDCQNMLSESIIVGGENVGVIEVYSTARLRTLKFERTWIRTFAERIGGAVRRLELEESLKGYSEQLEEMVEERTRDLHQAHEQVLLLSNTVRSSIDGITLADMEGNLTFANEAAEKMWGYGSDDLAGMKMWQLYEPEQRDLVRNEILPRSESNMWTGELTALRKDAAKFPVLVTASSVYDEEGKIVAVVAVHRDVTETKAMRDKLIRSERLAAVGELASGVGHELRNPLNVIRSCVYLIEMMLSGDANEEIRAALKALDQQVDISNKIVTDLLNFTRVRPPALARVDLKTLVKESLSWIAMPEDITVVMDLDPCVPAILADAEQVGRAFANIAANA